MSAFSFSSELKISAADFFATLNMAGVNAELHPFVKMTAPEDWATRPILEWPARSQLFYSWILFLGIIPIDRHAFHFDTIVPNEGFSERSSSLINAVWCHRRTVTPTKTGCVVVDMLEYKCRLALLTPLLKPMYRAVFSRRHRTLRAMYDGNLV